jgi:alpha-beta hydrolase superfamily lysophospholipase
LSGDPASTLESVTFQSEGTRIEGCLYQPKQPAPPANPTRAVILCHGALEHQENWSAYARRLAENGFQVLTFDFSGHGKSEGLPGAVEMGVWAYNLRDGMNFLGRRGCQHVALVGWNSGGSAALLAAAHDARVRCLVTMAAPVRMMPYLSDRMAYGGAAFVSKLVRKIRKRPITVSRLRDLDNLEMAVDPAVNQQYCHDPLIRKAYAAVPIAESLDSLWLDITTPLKRIQAPVLILHGDKDRIVALKQSQLLSEFLPAHKKLHVVENAGHALHLDQARDEVFIQMTVWIKKYL